MENEAFQSLTLKILVEKEKNRVIFAESDKDFVDVLFSFMTMPIAEIVRLTHEHVPKRDIGCLNSLYESIENLDRDYLQSLKCKDMLLHPRSAAEIYCRNLKLNLVETNTNDYYACCGGNCNFVSCYQTTQCRCGKDLGLEVKLLSPKSVPQERGGFVKRTAHFMISDDLQVMPPSTMTALTLLKKLGALDGSTVEERKVNIGRDEVVKLLKCSLTSKTPFSDSFMEPPISSCHPICHAKSGPRSASKLQEVMDNTNIEKTITLKLIVKKFKNRVLYAEVEEDFVNLLCSFLTFPLGYVFKKFPCLCFKGCTDNLYKSIQDFDVNKVFKSQEMKETLVDPKLAPGLAYNNQLICIEEALYPSYSILSSLFETENRDLDSKSHQGEAKTDMGFIKGPSKFMVTDNLIITPLSPISGISLINRLKVPLSDIREQEVTIGEDEALRLLVASLTSRYALTDAFMRKEPKREQ